MSIKDIVKNIVYSTPILDKPLVNVLKKQREYLDNFPDLGDINKQLDKRKTS